MIMVIDPIEVFGSSPGGSDKVRVGIGNGTELGSLTGSLEGSPDGVPYGSLLGDSMEVKTRSM